MPRTFDCPKCGAPVAFEPPTDFNQTRPKIRCDYCHSQLIPPDELAGQPARVVRIQFGSATGGAGFTKWLWVIIAIPVIAGVIIVLAVLGVLAPAFYSVTRAVREPGSPSRPNTPTKEKPNSFANEVLTFGSEGIGPGMFNDARSIGVDGAGKIYVGEYTGGRIQVFDPAGKFITQWTIGDRKTILRGLAVDRRGTVYAAQGGKIVRYAGETGEMLGELSYERSGADDVASSADGGLVAAWHSGKDDIVVFDANGKVVRTIPEAISGATGDSELSMRVAVDGQGNIYALGRFNNGVFKFARDRKFMNRFGTGGDEPGQLRAPYSIAVDGYGRVYVGDIKGIQVFDSAGRYLNTLQQKGMAFGMVFNDKNELFVIAKDRVIKYAVPAP